MKHTNAPPVYLLCFGELGYWTEKVLPARIKQLLHIVQFPNEDYVLKSSSQSMKETRMWAQNAKLNGFWNTTKKTDLLMHRLLFSRQQPLVLVVADPADMRIRALAEKNLAILSRAGVKPLGLFLGIGSEELADVHASLSEKCLGYTSIPLTGHEEDLLALRRSAMACVKQIELLYHLATYPDREPSFLRMLPLLLKDSPQFVLAAGFAEDNLMVAGERLYSQLNERLRKPVRGRSLVMILTNKHYLGFHEISMVNNACSKLLGRRMLITPGGRLHPHLRKGQYLLIGMVNEYGS